MTNDSAVHLSEEALNDVLIGLGSPGDEAHLVACPACRARRADFRAQVQAFGESSLAWSEARAAAMPRPSKWQAARRVPIPALGLALAAMLLVAVAAPLWHHFNSSGPSSSGAVVPPVSASGDSEAQIAQDNELLRSVDVALNTDAVAPLNPYGFSPYGFSDKPRPHSKARRKRGTE